MRGYHTHDVSLGARETNYQDTMKRTGEQIRRPDQESGQPDNLRKKLVE